jgi:hypothetical protein
MNNTSDDESDSYGRTSNPVSSNLTINKVRRIPTERPDSVGWSDESLCEDDKSVVLVNNTETIPWDTYMMKVTRDSSILALLCYFVYICGCSYLHYSGNSADSRVDLSVKTRHAMRNAKSYPRGHLKFQ